MAELKRTNAHKVHAKAPVAAKPPASAEDTIGRSLEALAAMGDGELAYVRAFRAADLRTLFPQTADLHPAVQLFALFGADGTPLMLADSRDTVVTGAWQNDLSMATLH